MEIYEQAPARSCELVGKDRLRPINKTLLQVPHLPVLVSRGNEMSFSKFIRSEDVDPGQITDRDLDILQAMPRYRLCSADQLLPA